ncbi:MAG: winged-helix domain-containing protein [Pyrobaculum sp.]|jgi:hypothetical protein
MPHGLAKKVKRRMREAYRYVKTRRCSTIASLARALGVEWGKARRVLNLLKKSGKVVEVTFGGKLLWCISEDDAAEVLHAIRSETWRLICSNRLRYVYPSRLAKLVAEDMQARRVFARYASLINSKLFDAVLRDMLGETDRRGRKKIYVVPDGFCAKPPLHIKPHVYKPRRNIVNVRISGKMAKDIEKAAGTLGVDKPRLIRLAIERLLEQYRHML